MLKGRSNYLCRQRAAEVGQRGVQQEMAPEPTQVSLLGDAPAPATAPPALAPAPLSAEVDPGDGRLVSQVRALIDWAEVSPTGDRADLPFEPSDRAWAMVSVGPRECPGAFRCPSGGDCFAESARAAAAAADVVVVNTHLYGSHLASGGMVLPPHDVAVFDEAHELEEVMTQSLGVERGPGPVPGPGRPGPAVRPGRPAAALDGLAEIGDRLADELSARLGSRVLFDGPADPRERRRGARARGPGAGPPGPAVRPGGGPPTWPTCWPWPGPGSSRLGSAAGVRRHRRRRRPPGPGAERGRQPGRGPGPRGGPGRRRRRLGRRDGPGPGAPALAHRRRPARWPGSLWPQVTAVLTSATIPLRLPERLGLTGFDVDQLDVGSPFDYRGHSLLYVARHLPDPRRPGAEPALHDELEALIGAAGGRTLALFTSRRATEAAAAALAERLDYRMLVQGDLPKGRLLEAFADDETSCLFATLGFWQGVDVPGPGPHRW